MYRGLWSPSSVLLLCIGASVYFNNSNIMLLNVKSTAPKIVAVLNLVTGEVEKKYWSQIQGSQDRFRGRGHHKGRCVSACVFFSPSSFLLCVCVCVICLCVRVLPSLSNGQFTYYFCDSKLIFLLLSQHD